MQHPLRRQGEGEQAQYIIYLKTSAQYNVFHVILTGNISYDTGTRDVVGL